MKILIKDLKEIHDLVICEGDRLSILTIIRGKETLLEMYAYNIVDDKEILEDVLEVEWRIK